MVGTWVTAYTDVIDGTGAETTDVQTVYGIDDTCSMEVVQRFTVNKTNIVTCTYSVSVFHACVRSCVRVRACVGGYDSVVLLLYTL